MQDTDCNKKAVNQTVITPVRAAAALLGELHPDVPAEGYTDSLEVIAYYRFSKCYQTGSLLSLAAEVSDGLSSEMVDTLAYLTELIRYSGDFGKIGEVLLLRLASQGKYSERDRAVLTAMYSGIRYLKPCVYRPQMFADSSYEAPPAPVPDVTQAPAPPVEEKTTQVAPDAPKTTLGGSGWLIDGQYKNSKGVVENLLEKDSQFSPEGAVAACLFTVVAAIRRNEYEVATNILEVLPNQVGQMLRATTMQTIANAKEDSAKKLTEEWTSTLANIDQLFPVNEEKPDAANLIGSTIREMAAVKAGMYPPLSTLVQMLNRAVSPMLKPVKVKKGGNTSM